MVVGDGIDGRTRKEQYNTLQEYEDQYLMVAK